MSRLHIHIATDDIHQNLSFYSALFGAEPSVLQPDYAKWELSDPAVNFAISSRGAASGLDHVGIQAEEASELAAIKARLEAAGVAGREQADTHCCYARSDKYWSVDPQGIAWEAFHTLGSSPTFNGRESAVSATDHCGVPSSAGACC